ncbi:TIGR02391 family protein [Streptomyces sp. 2RAF24]|uniref:TIGR02391 family protein n=1 Tax=Streptomyces sp. 2RAF24 TaxID=3232997 RepID=UPI003F9555D0
MAFQEERDIDLLTNRLSDAWSWLEAHALLSRVPRQSENFRQLSRDGRELAADPKGLAHFEARTRLAGPLHPDLEKTVRTNFDLGDYETACVAAMKAVEVAVRDASGLDNSLVGVALMRKAFQPHQNGKPGGPLADAGAEGGEQEAENGRPPRCGSCPTRRSPRPTSRCRTRRRPRSTPPGPSGAARLR